jgi:glycosyltransferase involved in cell wall biosynthesis
VVGATVDHRTVRDASALVSWWSLHREHAISGEAASEPSTLALDGRPVVAVDLRHVDTQAPWLLHAEFSGDPRARLSDHPALAAFLERAAQELEADLPVVDAARTGATWDPATTALGTSVDPALRALYRALPADVALGGPDAPDPFDPSTASRLLDWLTDPAPDGGPGRYLRSLHGSRPDLRDVFAAVPGADVGYFLRWVADHAVDEGYAPELVARALRRVPEAPQAVEKTTGGVNVVGFLRGELGIGESARLLTRALTAAGVPHTDVSVDQHLLSRQNAPARLRPGPVYDTSVICVNADLTPTISRSARGVIEGGYRIGMWYWEVEEFPASRHVGFAHLDEIWVATDFVRDAVERHSPIPVHVITPPLPQRGADPVRSRADLGLPDGPLFLFSFDFLSTAERKNPLGLVTAFRRAFRRGEGPVLVIKSINADRRPAEAERLRLTVAGEPDMILIEGYLDAADRDALVALSDCYVSLHRSEGLGLTMAEAMAWGRPVVATAYSGNMQFMTEENSFLVPWTPAPIPAGADPYPAGGIWADPDLDAAAAAMRSVIDYPGRASAKGARAAADIARLHSPEAAGRLVAARLAQVTTERLERARAAEVPPPTVTQRLAGRARRAVGRH